jgi:hypothetical protein
MIEYHITIWAIVNIKVALCFIVLNETGLKKHVHEISTYYMHNKHVWHWFIFSIMYTISYFPNKFTSVHLKSWIMEPFWVPLCGNTYMLPHFSKIAYWNFLPLTLSFFSLGIAIIIKDLSRSCGGAHKRRKVVWCSGLHTFLCGMLCL